MIYSSDLKKLKYEILQVQLRAMREMLNNIGNINENVCDHKDSLYELNKQKKEEYTCCYKCGNVTIRKYIE